MRMRAVIRFSAVLPVIQNKKNRFLLREIGLL
ncbi:hypothetical protein N786_13095 [Bacillus amyloliquefaciens UASWS BA1]|nr:hypothetical protein N786_13095 [Bacillus amyloliquefaciens UASWS BA1]